MKTTYSPDMEETLFLLIKSKNKKAFNFFYNLFGSAMYAIIDKNLKDKIHCDDVFQGVFLKISQDIDQYDSRKSMLFSWMSDIAEHEIQNVNSSFYTNNSLLKRR